MDLESLTDDFEMDVVWESSADEECNDPHIVNLPMLRAYSPVSPVFMVLQQMSLAEPDTSNKNYSTDTEPPVNNPTEIGGDTSVVSDDDCPSPSLLTGCYIDHSIPPCAETSYSPDAARNLDIDHPIPPCAGKSHSPETDLNIGISEGPHLASLDLELSAETPANPTIITSMGRPVHESLKNEEKMESFISNVPRSDGDLDVVSFKTSQDVMPNINSDCPQTHDIIQDTKDSTSYKEGHRSDHVNDLDVHKDLYMTPHKEPTIVYDGLNTVHDDTQMSQDVKDVIVDIKSSPEEGINRILSLLTNDTYAKIYSNNEQDGVEIEPTKNDYGHNTLTNCELDMKSEMHNTQCDDGETNIIEPTQYPGIDYSQDMFLSLPHKAPPAEHAESKNRTPCEAEEKCDRISISSTPEISKSNLSDSDDDVKRTDQDSSSTNDSSSHSEPTSENETSDSESTSSHNSSLHQPRKSRDLSSHKHTDTATESTEGSSGDCDDTEEDDNTQPVPLVIDKQNQEKIVKAKEEQAQLTESISKQKKSPDSYAILDIRRKSEELQKIILDINESNKAERNSLLAKAKSCVTKREKQTCHAHLLQLGTNQREVVVMLHQHQTIQTSIKTLLQSQEQSVKRKLSVPEPHVKRMYRKTNCNKPEFPKHNINQQKDISLKNTEMIPEVTTKFKDDRRKCYQSYSVNEKTKSHYAIQKNQELKYEVIDLDIDDEVDIQTYRNVSNYEGNNQINNHPGKVGPPKKRKNQNKFAATSTTNTVANDQNIMTHLPDNATKQNQLSTTPSIDTVSKTQNVTTDISFPDISYIDDPASQMSPSLLQPPNIAPPANLERKKTLTDKLSNSKIDPDTHLDTMFNSNFNTSKATKPKKTVAQSTSNSVPYCTITSTTNNADKNIFLIPTNKLTTLTTYQLVAPIPPLPLYSQPITSQYHTTQSKQQQNSQSFTKPTQSIGLLNTNSTQFSHRPNLDNPNQYKQNFITQQPSKNFAIPLTNPISSTHTFVNPHTISNIHTQTFIKPLTTSGTLQKFINSPAHLDAKNSLQYLNSQPYVNQPYLNNQTYLNSQSYNMTTTNQPEFNNNQPLLPNQVSDIPIKKKVKRKNKNKHKQNFVPPQVSTAKNSTYTVASLNNSAQIASYNNNTQTCSIEIKPNVDTHKVSDVQIPSVDTYNISNIRSRQVEIEFQNNNTSSIHTFPTFPNHKKDYNKIVILDKQNNSATISNEKCQQNEQSTKGDIAQEKGIDLCDLLKNCKIKLIDDREIHALPKGVPSDLWSQTFNDGVIDESVWEAIMHDEW